MYDESDAEFDRLQAESERIDAIVDEEYDSRMADTREIAKIIENNADILENILFGKASEYDDYDLDIEQYAYLLAKVILKHEQVLETIKRCVRNECEADLNL